MTKDEIFQKVAGTLVEALNVDDKGRRDRLSKPIGSGEFGVGIRLKLDGHKP